MPLIHVILVLAVIGLLVWAITTLIPMDPRFARAIQVVAIVGACLWLLSVLFGFNLTSVRV